MAGPEETEAKQASSREAERETDVDAGAAQRDTAATGGAGADPSRPANQSQTAMPAGSVSWAEPPPSGILHDAAARNESLPRLNSMDERTKGKKKPRLHWDEQNLIYNALEKEKNAYPKIDEPKTPFHVMSGSEGGSSSGSAPQSPGSPAFIERDQLIGFADLERRRSVQIADDPSASSGGESTPRSREEFNAKRKQHYSAEFRRATDTPDSEDAEEEDGVEEEDGGEGGTGTRGSDAAQTSNSSREVGEASSADGSKRPDESHGSTLSGSKSSDQSRVHSDDAKMSDPSCGS